MGEYRIKVVVEGEGGAEIERMGSAVKGVNRQVEGLDARLRTVFSTLDRVGQRMMLVGTGIVGGLGALAVVGGKSRIELDKAEAKLETFFKTSEKVKEAMTWAETKEIKTPFDETELMNVAGKMKQYGLDYKTWFDTVGDTAVATTESQEEALEKSKSLSKALGSIVAGQKRGFTTLAREFPDLMTKAGLSIDETSEGWAKMVDKPEEALKKLKDYMNNEYGGAMERMSKTSGVMLYRVKDMFMDALRDAATPAMASATEKLKLFIQYIQTPVGKAKMEAAVKSLSEVFMTAVRGGEMFFTKVWPKLGAILDWFDKLDPRIKLAIPAVLMLGGGAMMLGGKVGMAVLGLKAFVGILGGGAGGGGLVGSCMGAVGPILGVVAAFAAMVAQLYGLVKISDWVAEKLGAGGWGISGGLKKGFEFSKGWDPLSGKFGNWSAWGGGGDTKGNPLDSQRPITTWGPYEPEPATPVVGGGGDGTGGNGGSGGGIGGMGGSGGGSGRGAFTLYQTIEKVVINGEVKDTATLLNTLGKLATSEAGAIGG